MINNYNKKNDYAQYVAQEDDTLLSWLLANLKESRSKVKATLQGRGIKVNGKQVTQFDFPIHKGDKISISRSKKNDQFKSRYLSIVYEDKYLVVIEKNVGILSMAAGHSSLNVKTILDDYFRRTRQRCTAHVVHRLDRDTSGLMIYAKDMQTEQILEHDWHNIVYDRRYVAVVSGEMEDNEGTIANWLKDNKNYVTYSSPTDNGGKLAITHYKVIRRSEEKNCSLVELHLETGRTNQIRVHLASIGHPVLSDRKYGLAEAPIDRLALHARILEFIHPVTEETLHFETPVPREFLHLFH